MTCKMQNFFYKGHPPLLTLGYKRSRSLIVVNASGNKLKSGEKIPVVLLGKDPATFFNQINLTTADSSVIEKLSELGQLTTETISSSNVDYGAAILRYKGNE